MFTAAGSFFLFRVGLFDIIFKFKMFLLYLHDVEWFMTYVKWVTWPLIPNRNEHWCANVG